MQPLSSNHYSVDDQIADVVSYLSLSEDPTHREQMERFVAEFPEYNDLQWSGSWVDAEASGVDAEYMSWVADWIESNTAVTWEEGEPWLTEEGDDTETEDES